MRNARCGEDGEPHVNGHPRDKWLDGNCIALSEGVKASRNTKSRRFQIHESVGASETPFEIQLRGLLGANIPPWISGFTWHMF